MADQLRRNVQCSDLSSDRRRAIFESGEDSASVADIARIERNRRFNQAGTTESRITGEERAVLGAWNNASQLLVEDEGTSPTEEEVVGTGIGQSHRLRLAETTAHQRPHERRQQLRPVGARPAVQRLRRRSPSPPTQKLRIGSIEINHDALALAKQMQADFQKAKAGKKRAPPSKPASMVRFAQANARQRAVRPPVESSLTAVPTNIQATPARRTQQSSQGRENNPPPSRDPARNPFRGQLADADEFKRMYAQYFVSPNAPTIPGQAQNPSSPALRAGITARMNRRESATVPSTTSASTNGSQSAMVTAPAVTQAPATPNGSVPDMRVPVQSEAPPVVEAFATSTLEDAIEGHVLRNENGSCGCRIGECEKAFKNYPYWRSHVLRSHEEWLEKLKATLQESTGSVTEAQSTTKPPNGPNVNVAVQGQQQTSLIGSNAQHAGVTTPLVILETSESAPAVVITSSISANTTRPSHAERTAASLSLSERVARQRDAIIGEHVSRSRFLARSQVESLYTSITDSQPGQSRTVQRASDPGEAARRQYMGIVAAVPPSSTGVFVQPSPSATRNSHRSGRNRNRSGGGTVPAFLHATDSATQGETAPRQPEAVGAVTIASPTGGFVQPSPPASRDFRTSNTRNGSGGATIPAFLQATKPLDPGEAARRQYGGR